MSGNSNKWLPLSTGKKIPTHPHSDIDNGKWTSEEQHWVTKILCSRLMLLYVFIVNFVQNNFFINYKSLNHDNVGESFPYLLSKARLLRRSAAMAAVLLLVRIRPNITDSNLGER